MTIISHCTSKALNDAAMTLHQGHLVLFPTETVYGLGGDADNPAAIERIYAVKGRPLDHPVIVHIGDLTLLEYWVTEIPGYALRLARDLWPGSMTLVLRRSSAARDFITGGQESVGIRIPSHPLALELLKAFHSLDGKGIAAPSANRFGEVSPTTAQAAEKALGDRLLSEDVILDGGPCLVGIESTVIDCLGSAPRILRPGAVTAREIRDVTGLEVLIPDHSVRVPGSLENHYAPTARVIVGNQAQAGAGFIALKHIPTPTDMTRLAAPESVEEYARILYKSFIEADHQGIKSVVLVPPEGDGLAAAIRDRIEKARTKDV